MRARGPSNCSGFSGEGHGDHDYPSVSDDPEHAGLPCPTGVPIINKIQERRWRPTRAPGQAGTLPGRRQRLVWQLLLPTVPVKAKNAVLRYGERTSRAVQLPHRGQPRQVAFLGQHSTDLIRPQETSHRLLAEVATFRLPLVGLFHQPHTDQPQGPLPVNADTSATPSARLPRPSASLSSCRHSSRCRLRSSSSGQIGSSAS